MNSEEPRARSLDHALKKISEEVNKQAEAHTIRLSAGPRGWEKRVLSKIRYWKSKLLSRN
jgi:hypothetical protein